MDETGAWLSIMPSWFDGTQLTLEEWHDNIALQFGRQPNNLPDHCDGCGDHFSIKHALSCKLGGLVGIRHDDIRDEGAHLMAQALTTSRE